MYVSFPNIKLVRGRFAIGPSCILFVIELKLAV